MYFSAELGIVYIKLGKEQGCIMAKIYAKESAYASSKRKNLVLTIIFGSICGWLFIKWGINVTTFTMHSQPIELIVAHMAAFVITGAIASHFLGNYRKSDSGDTGIARALDVLEQLPAGYRVFTNIRAGEAFVGTVVVGRNGVFIINTKNHNGEIVPSNDLNWEQRKVGREGGEYTASMRNPVQQLKRQIHNMAQLLKRYHIRAWVDGIVYFTNPELILRGTSDRFTNRGDAVLEFILDYPVRTPLDEETIEKISAVLK
jgi:hypothetical protein